LRSGGPLASLDRFAIGRRLAPLDRDRLDRDRIHRTILPSRRDSADLLHDVQACDDFAEDRMAVVEGGRRTQRGEEMAAVAVLGRVCHRQDARFAVTGLGMEFVGELVAGPAGALAEAVAALNHEAVDDAVKDHAVVERRLLALAADRVAPFLRAFGETDEILYSVGRFLVEEADLEIAFGCLEIRVSGHGSSTEIVPQAPN